MRILVLGGTVFLGRAFVELAVSHGHSLTLLHRGKRLLPERAEGAFARCAHVLADRDSDLAGLGDAPFDAVFDTSGYVPRVVERNLRVLGPRIGRWLFVSSVSVYRDLSVPGLTEDAPLHVLDDPTTEEITGETYGGLKALCEAVCQRELGERACLVRPGLIVGPHDPTDRFGYWPWRIDRGGTFVAPAPPSAPVQFVDVRDLAAFCLLVLERDLPGTWHVSGEPLPFGELVDHCLALASRPAAPDWVAPELLLERGVQPWTDLPLWLPGPEYAGMQQIDISRARATGLRLRPTSEIVADSLSWMRSLERPLRAGLEIGDAGG